MGEMYNLLDMMVIAGGVYCLYHFYMMKFKGEIKSGLIVSKETDVKKCRDKEGFINYMAPRTLILGIVTIAEGAFSLASTYLFDMGVFVLIAIVLVLVVLVWFAMGSKKAQKIYW